MNEPTLNFTVQERLVIYTAALVYLNARTTGLCEIFHKVVNASWFYPSTPLEYKISIPEIYAQKPAKNHHGFIIYDWYGGYWWSPNDKASREKVLKEAIRRTKISITLKNKFGGLK